jgi:lipid-binding SYLF domain-containing protein
MRRAATALILALSAAAAGCASSQSTIARRSPILDSQVESALVTFKGHDSSLETFLRNAHGYAVFPSVGKGGFIVGGAHGEGQVFEQGELVGYATLTQGTVGLQAGGQTFSEIIVFKDQIAFDRFRSGKLEFSGQASAVAVKAGASTAAAYEDGVAIFTMSRGGLMLEASVGGQQFRYVPYE